MKNYAFVIPVALLFGALLDGLPYGYFQFLRIVVSIAGAIFAVKVYEKHEFFSWIFGVLVILFNPIAPITFPRETWKIIDVVAGIIFLIYGVVMIVHSRAATKAHGEKL